MDKIVCQAVRVEVHLVEFDASLNRALKFDKGQQHRQFVCVDTKSYLDERVKKNIDLQTV